MSKNLLTVLVYNNSAPFLTERGFRFITGAGGRLRSQFTRHCGCFRRMQFFLMSLIKYPEAFFDFGNCCVITLSKSCICLFSVATSVSKEEPSRQIFEVPFCRFLSTVNCVRGFCPLHPGRMPVIEVICNSYYFRLEQSRWLKTLELSCLCFIVKLHEDIY